MKKIGSLKNENISLKNIKLGVTKVRCITANVLGPAEHDINDLMKNRKSLFLQTKARI
jgi:hypothetical protein